MTVAAIIGGQTFEVAVPYKLRQLEAAAPHLDALNESARAAAEAVTGSVAGMATKCRHMLGAILPGIQKIDPSVTLDALVDEFDPAEWEGLREAFAAIFRKSGFNEGEERAAAAEAPAAA